MLFGCDLLPKYILCLTCLLVDYPQPELQGVNERVRILACCVVSTRFSLFNVIILDAYLEAELADGFAVGAR